MKFKLSQKAIDIIQWIIIIGLLAIIVAQGIGYKSVKRQLVTSEEYNKQNTYVRIYESQKLNQLKKENKELYDSISKLQDVESGMIIKFHEHYNTDTIKVDRFILKKDTVTFITEKHDTLQRVDSLYHYAQNNDTIDCKIDICASDLQWAKADITINDKFVIINREKDGVNQTLISHSDNTTIDSTAMFHRQDEDKKWYKRFSVGPQVGIGYGFFNKKPDVFIGIGVSYKLW
jgi:hypothetical protein